MSDFIVYTALFGNYDELSPKRFDTPIQFVCFTDDKALSVEGWEIRYVDSTLLNPRDLSRLIKFKPHEFLPEAQYTLYVDANIIIKKDPMYIFIKYSKISSIAIPKHRIRNCAFQEALACIEAGLIKPVDCMNQLERYNNEGLPKFFGLTENGIIFRKNTNNLRMAMNDWWHEYCCGVKRDQISLPYISWKWNLPIYILEETAFNRNEFFQYRIHKTQRRSDLWGACKDYMLERKFKYKILYKLSTIFNLINKILK